MDPLTPFHAFLPCSPNLLLGTTALRKKFFSRIDFAFALQQSQNVDSNRGRMPGSLKSDTQRKEARLRHPQGAEPKKKASSCILIKRSHLLKVNVL